MKNIIVVLMLLLASQILVADAQYESLELNDPNDSSSYGKSILPYILPTCSITEEDIRCVNDEKPEKPVIEKDTHPKVCDFPGACGEVDYNTEKFQIIKMK